MKILIISPDYPSKTKIGYQFVRDRVLQYKKEFEVDVFCFNKSFLKTYVIDGIKVLGGNSKKLLSIIKDNGYDKIAFHFLNGRSALFIEKYLKNRKVFIWFHGSDSVSWKRRLGRINYSKKKLINPIFLLKTFAFISFSSFRKFLIKKLNKMNNITFVFVSKWHKIASESDFKIKYLHSAVIHNSINFDEFKYQKKEAKDRYKVCIINTFANDLYAGDMMQDIILAFSKKDIFNKYQFDIYGDGPQFDKCTILLKDFKNVSINKGFLNHQQITQVHDTHGVLLYPKRGDSQGVSRCEAMASGLVCVASNVEAISEFTPSNAAYLAESITEFVKIFEHIDLNAKEFLEKSKEAEKFIRKKCSIENTILKEIKMFKE